MGAVYESAEEAAVVVVIVKVFGVTFEIIWLVLISDAGIPPTAAFTFSIST
jgi:hypothetical protein